MAKFIISLAILASIFLAQSITAQTTPYCRCRNPSLYPVCVPGSPPTDLKQSNYIPDCYCNGPYYPVCSGGWKEENVTSEVEKNPSPSEDNQERVAPPPPPPPPPGCICPAIWKPVCACEVRQKICKTFASRCTLNCAKKTEKYWCYHHEGECGSLCGEFPPGPPIPSSSA